MPGVIKPSPSVLCRTLVPLFWGSNVLEGAYVLGCANVLLGAYVLAGAKVLVGANVLAGANVLGGANVREARNRQGRWRGGL